MIRETTVRTHLNSSKTQTGSFILEALIAILIFSFGVLGIVGLQARSLKFTNDSQYRAEAVYHANSLLAKMWTGNATPTQLAADYDQGGLGPGYVTFRDTVAAPITGLPGATANPPLLKVNDAGDPPPPSKTSSTVHVIIYWQQPGQDLHQYETYGVVGTN
jgi:type IV pilus assembly protein PilV